MSSIDLPFFLKNFHSAFVFVFVFSINMASGAAANNALLSAETEFGLDLLRQSPANAELVFSPLSIILALTMVQACAKGKTKEQIDRVIGGGANDKDITNFYSSLSIDIRNSTNGVQTHIANAFFLQLSTRLSIMQLWVRSKTSFKMRWLGIEFLKEFGEHRFYIEDDRVQVLSLRYKDTSYAFSVFLPKKRFALDGVKRYLNGATVEQLFQA